MKANGAPGILIVGGALRMQAALAVTLRKHFVVTTTSTASEGLHRLTGTRPDLVILDSCLPDLKSVTFLRALRAHRPHCQVIILAEGGENDGLGELLDLRVDGIFPRSDHLDALLRRINSLLRKRRAGARQPPRRGLDRHVGEVIRHMAASSGNGLTVQGIARAVGLSSAQLAYLFRREIGMTIKDYATRVRVEIIKRLLADTDDKLDSIAEQLGFCDAAHLSRVFRRICGCPPGEYRRQSV